MQGDFLWVTLSTLHTLQMLRPCSLSRAQEHTHTDVASPSKISGAIQL